VYGKLMSCSLFFAVGKPKALVLVELVSNTALNILVLPIHVLITLLVIWDRFIGVCSDQVVSLGAVTR
jgi:hypothetical protein